MSQRKILVTGLLFTASLWLTTASAQAQEGLSAQALAHCAAQVQTLRQEAARLNKLAARNDVRRKQIAARHAAASESPELLLGYNSAARQFNADMLQFRQDVTDLNAIRAAYDAQCANRSYRRADLQALPESLANAMRTGLGDVSVPSLSAASTSPLSEGAQP